MEFVVNGHQLFRYHDDKAVHQTPKDKVKGKAVPNTGDKPSSNGCHIHRQTLTKVTELRPGGLAQLLVELKGKLKVYKKKMKEAKYGKDLG